MTEVAVEIVRLVRENVGMKRQQKLDAQNILELTNHILTLRAVIAETRNLILEVAGEESDGYLYVSSHRVRNVRNLLKKLDNGEAI